jgi:hypothetical protein
MPDKHSGKLKAEISRKNGSWGTHTHTQESHGEIEGATQTYHPLQNVWYRPLGFGGRRGEAEAEAASTQKGKETEEEEAAAVAQ